MDERISPRKETATLPQQLIPTDNNNLYQLISTDRGEAGIQAQKTLRKSAGQGDYDNDILFDELNDLVSQDFRAWYCKCFYKLGRNRVMEIALQCRASQEARDKRRIFSYMLKQEVSRQS